MKTPRELILERHQAAEAKLNAIRGEDLAACARAAVQPGPQRPSALFVVTADVGLWREMFLPWRRAWTAMAAVWVFVLAFTLASGERPRVASASPVRPDPEALAILQEQKQLLAQLLGVGAPTLESRFRASSPRSEAEPPRRGAGTGRLETINGEEAMACV